MVTENKRLLQRRDSAADWVTAATVLADGEVGYETDTGGFKIGDGSTAWASLLYVNVPSVTSMPTSPMTGMRVWRSDLDFEFFYDGTRWLSTTLLVLYFSESDDGSLVDYVVGELPVPFDGVNNIWIESCDIAAYKGSNSGTWTVFVHGHPATGASTLIATHTFTQTSQWSNVQVAENALLFTACECLELYADEISGTTDCYACATINYRLVGT